MRRCKPLRWATVGMNGEYTVGRSCILFRRGRVNANTQNLLWRWWDSCAKHMDPCGEESLKRATETSLHADNATSNDDLRNAQPEPYILFQRDNCKGIFHSFLGNARGAGAPGKYPIHYHSGHSRISTVRINYWFRRVLLKHIRHLENILASLECILS